MRTLVDGRRARGGRLVSLTFLAAAGLGGCVSNGVPDWARHVQPATVDPRMEAAAVADRLAFELGYPRIGRGHLAAEQIAIMAVREIQAGRLADAGLWLTLANYRYWQQVDLALTAGTAGAQRLPPGVPVDAYYKLVEAEIERFGDLEFTEQLDVVHARLRGADEVDAALQQQLAALGKTSAVDQETMRTALTQLRQTVDPSAVVSRYPRLVEAFRKRLLNDAARRPEWRVAAHYLSRAPIAALQREAIFVAPAFFDPPVCNATAEAFPLHRPLMIKALSDRQPRVRANAAATLGLAPIEESRTALEARLAVETDENVKLAIAFALVHHGAAEHLAPLTAALATCQPATCTLPASLIDWLPLAVKAELDQAPLARITADPKIDLKARRFAAAILRDIGTAKPLDRASIDALIVAGRMKAKEKLLPELANEALENATNLPRAEVVARLAGENKTPEARVDVLQPGPLLARLSTVATAEDVPLLRHLMSRFGRSDGHEGHYIVAATLNIPGEAANASLGNWMVTYPKLETHIGIGLALREEFPRDKLLRLLERTTARTELLVRGAVRAANTQASLLAYLKSEDLEDRFQAAALAPIAENAEVVAELYRLVDFEDARIYPNDVLLRHAAAGSLVRIALARAKRPATTTAAAAPAGPAPPATP